MKKHFHRTLYRLLAICSTYVNWKWLNQWKLMAGITLISPTATAETFKYGQSRITRPNPTKELVGHDNLSNQQDTIEEQMVCYLIIEDMPMFTRGNIQKYIQEHLQYPSEALKDEITGSVYVKILIDSLGDIKNPEIIKSLHPLLDKQALDFVSTMPGFLPARQRAKSVSVTYILPVKFTWNMIEEARANLNTFCYIPEELPSSPWDILERYVWDRISNPEKLIDPNVKGKVFAEITVYPDGSVKDERILQSKCPALEAEVLRIIQNIDYWPPAQINKKTVKETYILSVPYSQKFFKDKAWRETFVSVEEMPLFPQGDVNTYIQKHLQYPPQAKAAGIQGKVYVQFVIDENGWAVCEKVVRSVHSLLDTETLRIIREMPRWKPGKQNGKTVRVSYLIPVEFKLNDSDRN